MYQMAFIAVGALLLGSAGSWYWWGLSEQSTSDVTIAPPVVSTSTSITKSTNSNKKTIEEEPNLIDELKIALALRRLRKAPGTL